MNNEQNNMFGIPNQGPLNNQTMPSNDAIPGANLTPITSNDNTGATPVNQPAANLTSNQGGPTSNGTLLTPTTPEILNPNPIPGIVTGAQPVNTPNVPNTPINTLPSENLNSVNNNSVLGTIDGTKPVSGELNNSLTQGLNPGMMNAVETTPVSPLNASNNPMGQTILNPNIPINQPSMPASSNGTINNNLGDATPLTNETADSSGSQVVSVWKYLLTLILFSIPVIGTIMLFVKAFGGERNKNIKNLARAQLLLAVIIFVVMFVFGLVIGSRIISAINDFGNATNNSSYYDYDYDYDFDY